MKLWSISLLAFLWTLLVTSSVYAMNYPGCTEWKARSGVSCQFAGNKQGQWWSRNCANAEPDLRCLRNPGNLPPDEPCLEEAGFCFNENPNAVQGDCTKWVIDRSSKCGVAGRPKTWRRVCQWAMLPTKACTDRGRSYPLEEDIVGF